MAICKAADTVGRLTNQHHMRKHNEQAYMNAHMIMYKHVRTMLLQCSGVASLPCLGAHEMSMAICKARGAQCHT